MTIQGPLDDIVRPSPHVIDMRRFGARADGKTDTASAIAKALQSQPPHLSPWSNSRTHGLVELYFPPALAPYHFKTQVGLSAFHNISISAYGAMFTSDVNAPLYRLAEAGKRHSYYLLGATFGGCQATVIEGNSRNKHVFQDLLVVQSPGFAIQSDGPSVINVTVERCEFYECHGDVACDYDQSTGWVIWKNLFTRSHRSNIRMRGDNAIIDDNRFEQRLSNIEEPFINFIGTSTWVQRNSFGNEVGSSLGPPRDLIVVGELTELVPSGETAAVSGLNVLDNFFIGVGQGADPASGTNVFRMNNASHNMVIRGNAGIESPSYGTGVFFNHSKPNDGVKNQFHYNPGASLANFNRPPSINSWSIL